MASLQPLPNQSHDNDLGLQCSVRRQMEIISVALQTMLDTPFSSEIELNRQLRLGAVPSGGKLHRSDGDDTFLPGQPRVALTEPVELKQYLEEEHSTVELDTLAPKLWLVCIRAEPI